MAVKTTLNLHQKVLEQIYDAAEKTGKSKSEIIISLLIKVMRNDTRKPVSGPVKYQDCDSSEMWHKFHIRLSEDEYEYFTDLRKILKRSVSLLVAFAVKKYLYDLLFNKNSDNWHCKNHFLVREDTNGIICWKIYWGNPKKIE